MIHGSAHVRELMVSGLSREGHEVRSFESGLEAVAHLLREAADLVVVGLSGVRAEELDLVRTLRSERPEIALLVTYPSTQRELAVRALEEGADAHLVEPFYPAELRRVVQGQLRPHAPAPTPAPEEPRELPPLVRELAHAVNNPLQVISLLLDDKRMAKKRLVEKVRAEVERIQSVVGHLADYGELQSMEVVALDPAPLVQQAVKRAGENGEAFRFTPRKLPRVLADRRALPAALGGVLDAVGRRNEEETPYDVEVQARADTVAFRLSVPRALFEGEKTSELSDALFVVRADRSVLPGLALSRSLLEAQGGSLTVREAGDRLELEAELRRA
ncbi:MAG: response regulator [Planctomycetota bacterium]